MPVSELRNPPSVSVKVKNNQRNRLTGLSVRSVRLRLTKWFSMKSTEAFALIPKIGEFFKII